MITAVLKQHFKMVAVLIEVMNTRSAVWHLNAVSEELPDGSLKSVPQMYTAQLHLSTDKLEETCKNSGKKLSEVKVCLYIRKCVLFFTLITEI
jgi:hypothetical protein